MSGYSIKFGIFAFAKNDESVSSGKMGNLFMDLEEYKSIKEDTSKISSKYVRLFDCDDVAFLREKPIFQGSKSTETFLDLSKKNFGKNYEVSISIDCHFHKLK